MNIHGNRNLYAIHLHKDSWFGLPHKIGEFYLLLGRHADIWPGYGMAESCGILFIRLFPILQPQGRRGRAKQYRSYCLCVACQLYTCPQYEPQCLLSLRLDRGDNTRMDVHILTSLGHTSFCIMTKGRGKGEKELRRKNKEGIQKNI